jgi:hypothetical protein
MITTFVRRVSDGLLADIQQGPALSENTTPRINNAIAQFGGAASDWQALEVPDGLWVNINPLARQLATVANGQITSISQSTPPQAALSASTVDADGLATITLTVTIPNYSGPVSVKVYLPSGDVIASTLTAVAGLASDTISTEVDGLHSVIVETVAHGVAIVEFTGV